MINMKIIVKNGKDLKKRGNPFIIISIIFLTIMFLFYIFNYNIIFTNLFENSSGDQITASLDLDFTSNKWVPISNNSNNSIIVFIDENNNDDGFIKVSMILNYTSPRSIILTNVDSIIQLSFDGMIKKQEIFSKRSNNTDFIIIEALSITEKEIKNWDNNTYQNHLITFKTISNSSFLVNIKNENSTKINKINTYTENLRVKVLETSNEPPVYKVVGVISNQMMNQRWKGEGILTESSLSMLTHINYAFCSPVSDSDTSLYTWNWEWVKLAIQAGHAWNIPVLLSMNGGDRLDVIFASRALRSQLITNMLSKMSELGLDGFDIDWESSKRSAALLETFLQELRTRMPAGKLLTMDGAYLASATREPSPEFVIEYLDWVNVMAYDLHELTQPSGAYHSRYEDVINVMNRWVLAGYPKEKLLLGIPFYGKDDALNTYNYYDIVNDLNPPPEQNLETGLKSFTGASGTMQTVAGGRIWWNGQVEVKRKIDFVIANKLGGVIYWELGRDKLNDPRSLAKTVNDALKAIR